MMASNNKSKGAGAGRVAPTVRHRQGPPWMTIIAVAIVVVLAGAIAWVVIDKNNQTQAAADKLAPWTPSADNRDPSTKIPGIYVGASSEEAVDDGTGQQLIRYNYSAYKALIHVKADQRVEYDRYPPVGGPHDEQWADCQGIVYTKPVRDENMVHTLEHGAVWIAYNPDTIKGADLDKLKSYVEGQNYITLTPYPGLKANVSLQAWAHQLQVESASDERIAEFITALRQNIYVYPETGARCDSPGWDSANPPAFDASPRTSKDVQMNGQGATAATGEMAATGGELPTESGAVPSGSDAGAGAGASDAPSGNGTGSGAVETSAAAPTS
jgi:hypothetical protein